MIQGLHFLFYTSLFLFGAGDTELSLRGEEITYLEDASSTMTLSEVLQKGAEFQPVQQPIPNAGLSNSTWWFRFEVHNSGLSDEITLLLEQPFLDLVEAYTVSKKKASLIDVIGNSRPFYDRRYPQLNMAFRIRVPPGQSQEVLLKIRSASPIVIPMELTTREQSMLINSKKELWLSIYCGIMLTTLLYNLFIFISIKDRSYLLYVIYILFILLTQTSLPGFTFKYLWPNSTFMALRGPLIFSCLAGIAALEFIRIFLHVREFTPKLARVFPLFNIAFIIALTMGLFRFPVGGFIIMQATTMLASIFALIIAIKILQLNYRPARYFLFAWAILLGGAIIFVLKDTQLIPYNNFTASSLLIASALESVLLSFALADKIALLRKEKDASQEQALAAVAEIARIDREQNVILESKVNERTLALKHANEELNKTLEELKDAESQLVESEKMASLGQLTAGIAHEINNPANFVAANVKPLKRDIAALRQLFEDIDLIIASDRPANQKEEKIRQLKDRGEYEYLKKEVDLLIDGIQEGARRISEIVKGLRNFSRLDESVLKKASVNEGIDSTLTLLNHMLGRNITVIRDYEQLPAIDCFPGKLNQVFLNILTNSIQAIREKFGVGEGGVISITTAMHGETVSCWFRDNGIGMDQETINKVFEPFFTTKKVNEGTGLGMSIVYSIIQKHQGRITVQSSPGKNTVFHLELPISHHEAGN